MSTQYTLLLVAGMLFTGTINTILNKLQDFQCVKYCDEPPSEQIFFEQPVWQTINMFLGELACLFVYSLYKIYERKTRHVGYHPISVDPSETPQNLESIAGDDSPTIPFLSLKPALKGQKNLYLWLPTLCDMTATTLMNIGLIFVSASIYQMLRGSVVIFTGILSYFFLNRRHAPYRWFALFTIFTGVALVGMSGIFQTDPQQESKPVNASGMGVAMVLLAQIFTAAQFVIEENILAKYEVPAIKAVGLEGLFGILSLTILFPILYVKIGMHGEPGGPFDIPGGFEQIIKDPMIFYPGIGIVFSIALFNWFGLTVTRYLSATSRSTVDTCRTLFIWMISLTLGWESFKWLQVVGFMILIYGTFLFNDVIKPPFGMSREPPVEEIFAQEEEE